MRKSTLARIEIDLTLLAAAVLFVLAGYGMISSFADRLDPKVRACIERSQAEAQRAGKPIPRSESVNFCKRLEAVGAL